MNESKALVEAGERRRQLRPEERTQVLAFWAQSGRSGEEVAREKGVSRQSLARWKLAARLAGREAAATPTPARVEVPAPRSGEGVAEMLTRHGPVRLFATATPAWAAALVRELNRC